MSVFCWLIFSVFFQTIADSNLVSEIYGTFIDKSKRSRNWSADDNNGSSYRSNQCLPCKRLWTTFDWMWTEMICVVDKLLDLRTQSMCGLVCVTNCPLLWYIHGWTFIGSHSHLMQFQWHSDAIVGETVMDFNFDLFILPLKWFFQFIQFSTELPRCVRKISDTFRFEIRIFGVIWVENRLIFTINCSFVEISMFTYAINLQFDSHTQSFSI